MKKMTKADRAKVVGGGIDTVSGILGGLLKKALADLAKAKKV